MVTPSFNQAPWLRQAIDSVLSQSWPHVDYMVVDGGSTDGSIEILRSFGDRLRWISEPDAGQADAIAKGFERTSGEILGWINSDDALLPGALERVVDEFSRRPDAGLVYGHGLLLDPDGAVTGRFPWIEPYDLWRLVHFSDYILQPSAFFRRSAYDAAGGLDRALHYAMDWDLWIRLAAVGGVAFLDDATLGCSRIHDTTKTSTGGWERIGELGRIARRHTGRRWTTAVQRYALDTLGQNLKRRLPGPLLRVAGWAGGLLDGLLVRRVPVHGDGWLGPRGELLFPRRWESARIELEAASRLRSAAGSVTVRVDEDPGRRFTAPPDGRLELRLRPSPSGRGPFCRVRLRSARWDVDRATRRRLAVRVVALEPGG